MIRQLIWVIAGLLALAIVALMIVTPTPPKPGQGPAAGITAKNVIERERRLPQPQ